MTLVKLAFTMMLAATVAKADINIQDLEKQLTTTGLKGEIHGASTDGHLFVITFRNPNDFFDNIQMPLTSEKKEVLDALQSIKRHQFYIVKGNFIKNKSPIKHINIESLELAKDYSSTLDHSSYEYKGNLEELKEKTEFIGRVHAVGEAGKMLVTEYKDRIVPIYVVEPAAQEIAKKLYRGDKILIRYTVRSEPEAPVHLSLVKTTSLPENQKPIEIIESLVKNHGTPVTKSGKLIMFPKSPQINTNVYALLFEDKEGTTIQYTLANLEDAEIFKQVRNKIEKVWMENSAGAINDRNKLVNPNLIVTAKGINNMVDAGQANPQIIISSPDDITIEVKKN